MTTQPSLPDGRGPESARAGRSRAIEFAGLLVIAALGFWLRAAHFDDNAVEHFDEGVYASNWYCRPPGLPELTYPQQHLYAPPLWPEVLRQVLYWSGGNPRSVLWVNVVLGTLTIVAVWWFARPWCGAIGALAAALLCAASDLHVALSRMALTDVPLGLFLVLSVGCGVRALSRRNHWWIVAAAVCGALAWWTKYNGWLALAITGAGLAGYLVFTRPQTTTVGHPVVRWCVIALLTALLWVPVVWSLQDVGGYSSVAANHSRYVLGFAGWQHSFVQQALKLRSLNSGIGCLAMLVSVFVVAITNHSTTGSTERRPWTFALGMVALVALQGVFLGTTAGLLSAALVNVVGRLISPALTREARLIDWVLAEWLIGLAVATPLYTPYPRLMLPLVIASWLGATLGTSGRLDVGRAARVTTVALTLTSGVVSAALLTLGLGPTSLLPSIAWKSRAGLQQVATETLATLAIKSGAASGREVDAILYVHAEPALFFHLSAIVEQQRFNVLVQPAGDLALVDSPQIDRRIPTYLLCGGHTWASGDDTHFRAAAIRRGALENVRDFEYEPSPLVTLDDAAPPLLRDQPEDRSIDITLDRLRLER